MEIQELLLQKIASLEKNNAEQQRIAKQIPKTLAKEYAIAMGVAEATLPNATTVLPNAWRVGSFVHKQGHFKMPAYLPLERSLSFVQDKLEMVHLAQQYIAFSLLENLAPQGVVIKIADFRLNPTYRWLGRLHLPKGVLEIIPDAERFKKYLDELLDLARSRIKNLLLPSGKNDLKAYNADARFKEPYYFIFVPNVAECIGNYYGSELYQKWGQLVSEGHLTGIYFINALQSGDLEMPTGNWQDQRQIEKRAFFQNLVHTDSEKVSFENDRLITNRYPEAAALYDYGYNFRFVQLADAQMTTWLQRIEGLFEKEKENDEVYLRVPMGVIGARDIAIEWGKNDAHHALVVGGTGSGKTTFSSELICKIGEMYSPDLVRLYLLDYKNGEDFKFFKEHPNVEKLLLDNSNIAFGIQVFREALEEIATREAALKAANARDLNSYNAKAAVPIPRIFILVEEFQELFRGKYNEKNEINTLLDKVARQGRSYGIHLYLSTNSMKGQGGELDGGIKDNTKMRIVLPGIVGGVLEYEKAIPFRHVLLDYQHGKDKTSEPFRLVKTFPDGDEDLMAYVKDLRLQSKQRFQYRPFEQTIIEKNAYSSNPTPEIATAAAIEKTPEPPTEEPLPIWEEPQINENYTYTQLMTMDNDARTAVLKAFNADEKMRFFKAIQQRAAYDAALKDRQYKAEL